MHDSRVILVRVLIVLSAVVLLVKAHAVTEGKASIGATSDLASSTTTQNKGASKRFLLGIVPPANLSSSLKRASTWLRQRTKSKSIRSLSWPVSKETLDDARRQLRLKLEAGPKGDLFSREFYAWVADNDRFKKLYPNDKLSLIDLLLDTYYTHLELAKVIELALDVFPTGCKHQKMATRLAKELMETWEGLEYDEYRVFELLRLSVEGTNIFERPELSMWFHYVVLITPSEVDGLVSLVKKKTAAVLAAYYNDDKLDAIIDKTYLGPYRLQRTFLNLATATISRQDTTDPSAY
uniref:RxLR effector candidate protein n=1 Tax=Hyaloperonospora arabidopsidis (strain Emoy2) TaxID=559515 RepID=M4BZU9_HYAAE|nr:RxLR effector candidate protein [Hyaloperonospora arabidopsidis Emoy2]